MLKIGDAGIYGSLNVRLCVLFQTSSDGSRQKILRRATELALFKPLESLISLSLL